MFYFLIRNMLAMDTFGSRLKSIREELRISRIELADSLGLTDVTVGYWERDEHIPSADNLLVVCKRLKTTPEFLLSGAGPRFSSETKSRPTNGMLLPVISLRTENGKLSLPFKLGDAEDWRTVAAPVSQDSFIIRPAGDVNLCGATTYPITDKAYVVIDPTEIPRDGSVVLVGFNNADFAALKILVQDGPHTYLKSLNPSYATTLKDETSVILGVAKRIEYDI